MQEWVLRGEEGPREVRGGEQRSSEDGGSWVSQGCLGARDLSPPWELIPAL